MRDLIGREEAIHAILGTESKVARETPYDSEVFGVMAKRQNEILDVLLTLPSAEPKTGWIPVTERLPKEHGAYLVTFPMMLKDKMSVTILLYGKPLMPNTEIKKVCWYDSDSEYGDIVYDDVVAWMPMPDPYEGGEGE